MFQNSITETPKSFSLSNLPVQQLTTAQLIQLDTKDKEVQLVQFEQVELRFTSSSTSYSHHHSNNDDKRNETRTPNVTISLTTHRIVFQTKTSCHFLHHCNINSHEKTGGEWISNRSYKVQIQIQDGSSATTTTTTLLLLIFRTGKEHRDKFYDEFTKSLSRRVWEEASKLMIQQQEQRESIMQSHVGLGAIRTQKQQKDGRIQQLVSDFASSGTTTTTTTSNIHQKKSHHSSKQEEIEKFFNEASELTKSIKESMEKIKVYSKSEKRTDQISESMEISSMMQNMGMVSALTSKDYSSTKTYHETLARQICDFFHQTRAIQRVGGIMTLTDVYCLFNRARGTNLISPEDLKSACSLMSSLNLDYTLRQFQKHHNNGIWVLQEKSYDDEIVSKKIVEYLNNSEQKINMSNKRLPVVGITTLDASRIFKVSTLIAEEQVARAEELGYLCRDTTIEGTRFYRNIFIS